MPTLAEYKLFFNFLFSPELIKLIKKGIQLRDSLEQKYGNPLDLQKNELLRLLIAARDTSIR
ncbi:MAG: hypothetical protein U5K79_07165 [Cyclobacteriaceae bacterium]|nr:hypothetical protein [Cyclobacteriaceae bacterium]